MLVLGPCLIVTVIMLVSCASVRCYDICCSDRTIASRRDLLGPGSAGSTSHALVVYTLVDSCYVDRFPCLQWAFQLLLLRIHQPGYAHVSCLQRTGLRSKRDSRVYSHIVILIIAKLPIGESGTLAVLCLAAYYFSFFILPLTRFPLILRQRQEN